MKMISDPLAQLAQKNPHRIFLRVENGEATSYQEAELRVKQLVGIWSTRGLRRGSHAACFLDESPESILTILAIIRIGAIFAPLPVPQPAAALASQLARVEATFLFFTDGYRALAGSKQFSGLKRVAIPRKWTRVKPETLPEPLDEKIPTWDLRQPFSLLFTSGSSGLPKIAGHRLGNFWENALASHQRIPFGDKDRWLLRLPLFHVGGLSILFRVLRGGGGILFPSARDRMVESLGNASHVSLVSTQFRRIAETRVGMKKLAGLKAVLLGGGPMPTEVLRKIRSAKVNVFTSYGLTEMSSQAATSRFRNDAGWLAPLRGVRIKVLENGEFAVKGPSLFIGYYEKGNYRKPFDKQGYFHTGDLGEKNARGQVRILGRGDGLIISGGENIQPEEIENAILKTFPALEAIVVGVPDAQYGGRPTAFIKWKTRSPSARDIRLKLKKKLAGFKVPDHFWEWPKDEASFKTGLKWSRPTFAKRALENLQALSTRR